MKNLMIFMLLFMVNSPATADEGVEFGQLPKDSWVCNEPDQLTDWIDASKVPSISPVPIPLPCGITDRELWGTIEGIGRYPENSPETVEIFRFKVQIGPDVITQYGFRDPRIDT